MKNRKLPIIIGHLKNGESDKCVAAFREESRVRVLICKLKDGAGLNSGDEVKPEEIEGIISEMWFCRRESLERFIGALQTLLDGWEVDGEK